jgi:hypothetical protein
MPCGSPDAQLCCGFSCAQRNRSLHSAWIIPVALVLGTIVLGGTAVWGWLLWNRKARSRTDIPDYAGAPGTLPGQRCATLTVTDIEVRGAHIGYCCRASLGLHLLRLRAFLVGCTSAAGEVLPGWARPAAQGSTSLWEELPAVIMDEALKVGSSAWAVLRCGARAPPDAAAHLPPSTPPRSCITAASASNWCLFAGEGLRSPTARRGSLPTRSAPPLLPRRCRLPGPPRLSRGPRTVTSSPSPTDRLTYTSHRHASQ